MSDADLVRRTLSGNRQAFEKLIDCYRGSVFAIILSKVRDFDAAQDLSQDTFVEAYMKLGNLKDHSKFSSWLRGIASNMSLRWLTKRNREDISLERILEEQWARGDGDLLADFETPESLYEDKELREVIWSALDAIPERNREVVILYYMEDLSKKEIARFLDIPIETVRGRLRRGRNALRSRLIDLDLFGDELRRRKPGRGFTRRIISALPTLGLRGVESSIDLMVKLLSYVLFTFTAVSFVGLCLWLGGVFGGGGGVGRAVRGTDGTSVGIRVDLMSKGESGVGVGVQQFAPPTKAPDPLRLVELKESKAGVDGNPAEDGLLVALMQPPLVDIEHGKDSYKVVIDQPQKISNYISVKDMRSSSGIRLGIDVEMTDSKVYAVEIDYGDSADVVKRSPYTSSQKNKLFAEIKDEAITLFKSCTMFEGVEDMSLIGSKGHRSRVDYLLQVSLEKPSYHTSLEDSSGNPIYAPLSGFDMTAQLFNLKNGEALWSLPRKAFRLVNPMFVNPMPYPEGRDYKSRLRCAMSEIYKGVISAVRREVKSQQASKGL